MTEIPRSVIDAFTEQLEMVSERHRRGLAEALARIDMDADVATVRDQVVAAMQVWCGGASDMSAMIAAEFYDGLRELCVGEPMGALVDGGRVPEATEGAVRAFVQDLVEGKAREAFVGRCLDRLDYEAKRAAAECVYRNGERDPKRVRYARVPGGFETCRFCLMLASRGFVYHSRQSAGADGHYHANCRCRVVPGWDGKDSKVEGYDPDALLRIWSRMESAEVMHADFYHGGREAVKASADALQRDINHMWEDGYRKTDRSARAYRDSFGNFVEGMSPEGRLHIEDFVRIEGKELQLGKWLADAGHDVVFRNPNVSGRDNTADAYIDGSLWEFKRVTSSKPGKLGTRITEKLDRQGPRFVVDLSQSDMSKGVADRKVAELLEDERISEILIVRNGQAYLMRK